MALHISYRTDGVAPSFDSSGVIGFPATGPVLANSSVHQGRRFLMEQSRKPKGGAPGGVSAAAFLLHKHPINGSVIRWP